MKYILYCRKSTDEKDKQVLSIEAQIAELKEFAQREHLEITEIITEAKTAKIPGREQFAQVLKKIEKREAQGILSWHPDRLARNSIDGGKVIYLLDMGKLQDLKFPTFWFENTPQGRFMLSIAFGQAKYYIDNLSENIKRGLRQKLRNGVWPTKAPLGYINDPKSRTIAVDSIKSKIIKRAFEIFTDGGKSIVEICRYLHRFGITGWTGKPIKIENMKRILSDTFYIGIMKYNGELYEGSHKCFISKELFAKVQKQIERIERPRYNGHRFPFAGLARCKECGAAITAEQHIKKYKNGSIQKFVYYRCTKKLRPCLQKYISEEDLETQLRKIVSDVVLPAQWGKQWFEWLERDEILEKQSSEERLEKLKTELENLDKKMNILLDGYLDQMIDSEIFKKKKNEIFAEKLKLQEEIAKAKQGGSNWLEPMREFIGRALEIEKVARAKNNPDELCSVGKTVGSNFYLLDRQLSACFRQPFQTLCASPPAQSRNSAASGKSSSVPRPGFEPG